MAEVGLLRARLTEGQGVKGRRHAGQYFEAVEFVDANAERIELGQISERLDVDGAV